MNYLFLNVSDERLADPIRLIRDATCFHEGVHEHEHFKIGVINTLTIKCTDCKTTLFVKKVNEEKSTFCHIYHDPVFTFFKQNLASFGFSRNYPRTGRQKIMTLQERIDVV